MGVIDWRYCGYLSGMLCETTQAAAFFEQQLDLLDSSTDSFNCIARDRDVMMVQTAACA